MPPTGVSNLELVRWGFDRFARGDPSGLVALATKETVARFPDRTCRGREEAGAWFQEEVDAIGDWRMQLIASAGEGDDVLLRWRMTGIHAGELEGIVPTGKPVTTDGLSHFVMRDGKAASVVVIVDRVQFATSIGMMGASGSVGDRVYKAVFNARTRLAGSIGRDRGRPARQGPPPASDAEPRGGAGNLELARAALDALARADPSALLALTTDETTATFPGTVARGTAQVAAQLRDWVAPFEGFTLEPVVIAAHGDDVLARWQAGGRHTGTFNGIAPTGRLAAVGGGGHMTFRDGRLVSFSVVVDRMQLLQTIGMLAAAGTPTDRVLKAVFNFRTKLVRGARRRRASGTDAGR